jgi:hypothetical protein
MNFVPLENELLEAFLKDLSKKSKGYHYWKAYSALFEHHRGHRST